jgi:hypothetical protein
MTRNLCGDVLIVEGEIKAMITWAAMWTGPTLDDDLLTPNLWVVGLPGKSWKAEYLPAFEKCKRVFICLDPDADKEAARMAASIGERAKVIRLPDKIDDLILAGVLDGFSIIDLLEG